MDIMDKIEKWFQVCASVLFVFFSLFNLVRTFIQTSDVFYAMCFAALLVLSWCLLKLSWRELKEQPQDNNINRRTTTSTRRKRYDNRNRAEGKCGWAIFGNRNFGGTRYPSQQPTQIHGTGANQMRLSKANSPQILSR